MRRVLDALGALGESIEESQGAWWVLLIPLKLSAGALDALGAVATGHLRDYRELFRLETLDTTLRSIRTLFESVSGAKSSHSLTLRYAIFSLPDFAELHESVSVAILSTYCGDDIRHGTSYFDDSRTCHKLFLLSTNK